MPKSLLSTPVSAKTVAPVIWDDFSFSFYAFVAAILVSIASFYFEYLHRIHNYKRTV